MRTYCSQSPTRTAKVSVALRCRFFFQAEDGIRDYKVTGVQTCALPIFAAHLANAGVSVLLLDLTPEVARDGLARARKLKPDPFFTPEDAGLVTTGSFEDRKSVV